MQPLNRKKNTACFQHPGEVVSITPTQIEVNIVSLSACVACHAKGFCSAFDQKEKNISVSNIGQNVYVGDKVNVLMKQSLGIQAVILAYLLPVASVILFLVTFTSLGVPDPVAGLLSLCILAIYYIVLYFFRNKLKKVYNFQIVKIE